MPVPWNLHGAQPLTPQFTAHRFQCDVANCLGEGFGAQLLKASMQGSQDTKKPGDLELDGFSESFEGGGGAVGN